jgi:CheY-like chemotaxis protein
MASGNGKRVRLIHWNAAEARRRAAPLRAAGYVVGAAPPAGPTTLNQLKRNPPAAVIIDLSRQPAQGRDFALAIREAGATRRVPLVFVGGDPQKVARIKRLLPDAVYTPWSRIRSALRSALANPPETPVVPGSRMAGYAGVPLAKKLGVKGGAVVALVGAPPGFDEKLGELPAGVTLRRRAGAGADLIVWFARDGKDLTRRVEQMARQVGGDGLWIAWPKKASGVATDLSPALIRRTAEAQGLVDYKICSIDEIWSGLKFARRKPRRP